MPYLPTWRAATAHATWNHIKCEFLEKKYRLMGFQFKKTKFLCNF